MSRPGFDLLLVSNGHGEDTIGARIAEALRERAPGLRLAALPLVGDGGAYRGAGVALLDPRRALPSGGFTLHHPSLAWQDLRAGLLTLTAGQVACLARQRPRGTFVVGDVYAQTLATLVRAPRRVLQPLVSVRMMRQGEGVAWNRSFMERILAPERRLMARAFDRVYARDAETASWLRDHGVPGARFVGNPMMDGLRGRPLPGAGAGEARGRTVALLPGTRGQAVRSVLLMLEALARLGDVHALVAWTHGHVPDPPGWARAPDGGSGPAATEGAGGTGPGVVAAHVRGGSRVWWVRGRFADVLASARVVVGTSGTAQEQAAGLGLPVVTFPLPPEYRPEYLRNQRRLLGGALEVVEPRVDTVAAAVGAALAEGAHREAARRDGPAAMGPPGASAALAEETAAWLEGLSPPAG